jgi:cytochrome b
LKRGEQLTVQVGVGVQATALIARMSSGSIGETAARFLDEENPWRVIPDVVALDQEGIGLPRQRSGLPAARPAAAR